MKIALVSYDFGEYCVRLANGLSVGVNVLLLLPKTLAADYKAQLAPAVTLFTFDKPRLRQPRQQLQTINQLLAAIKQFQPDVVHMQHRHLWFNLALPLIRTPLVVTVHDAVNHVGDRNGSRTPEWMMQRSWRQASRLITHGEQVKQQVVSQGVAAERVTVMPHIVMGERPSQSAERAFFDKLVLNVLFFGRIWPYKGLDILIAAQPHITAAVPNSRIIIAGEGEDFYRYQQMMVQPKQFEIHNRFVTDAERAELFRRADVVVLPYIEASQSGVIPVAYRAGKPVIATTVGSLPEVVEHGTTGLLVPPCDVNALANAVIRLLKDEGERLQMGQNAQLKIEREAGEAAIATQTLAVYRQAIGK